jgi:DNA adenine methylase
MLKYGENGKGIKSRWYPNTLSRRLVDIGRIAERIQFLQEDGLDVMESLAGRSDVIFFIDPPYTAGGKKAGKRLYRYFDIDHERLFSICSTLTGDFLMTYDNADEVKQMAKKYAFR